MGASDIKPSAAPPLPPPKLEFVGTLAELVQAGGGKLSQQAPDGPDIRKPPGQ